MLLSFEKPIHEIDERIAELNEISAKENISFPEILKLEENKTKLLKEIYDNLTTWETTKVARHPLRPTFLDYVGLIFSEFTEIHGDRAFADDKAIVCGFCFLDDIKCIIIGHQKGKDTNENVIRNFAMPRPEGYRKSLRVMELAAKFNIPIITFIDTPGAYPGIGAEKRGQSSAIAQNLFTMPTLKVPIIAIVIGEGGSGGALALGTADKVLMLKYAIYSVISPEGCATILWKDVSKAAEAATALKITASELLNFKIIDGIIDEPIGAAHRDPEKTAENIKRSIKTHLESLKKQSKKKLLDKRYNRIISIGAIETK